MNVTGKKTLIRACQIKNNSSDYTTESKVAELSSDGSLMLEQTFKVKEANWGIKITLEHFCWRTYGVQSWSD